MRQALAAVVVLFAQLMVAVFGRRAQAAQSVPQRAAVLQVVSQPFALSESTFAKPALQLTRHACAAGTVLLKQAVALSLVPVHGWQSEPHATFVEQVASQPSEPSP